jgi:hypothetical protein
MASMRFRRYNCGPRALMHTSSITMTRAAPPRRSSIHAGCSNGTASTSFSDLIQAGSRGRSRRSPGSIARFCGTMGAPLMRLRAWWVVCTPSPASQYFRQLPRWLAENEPDLRKITVMRSTCGTFAGHVAQGFAKEAGAAGYSVELVPFSEVSSRIREVLVLAGSFEEEARIIRSRPAPELVRRRTLRQTHFRRPDEPHRLVGAQLNERFVE